MYERRQHGEYFCGTASNQFNLSSHSWVCSLAQLQNVKKVKREHAQTQLLLLRVHQHLDLSQFSLRGH